jgi:hypothetical protein
MARKVAKKAGPKRSARRKVAAKSNRPMMMDTPEKGIPDYDVKVTELGELLVRIEVTNLNNNQTAMTTCGPKSDIEAIVEDLKVRLYDWS